MDKKIKLKGHESFSIKWYLREIKKLFPSNSEIDQYFREIFLL